MWRALLIFYSLGLIGCVSPPPMYDASAFEKKVSANPICINGKGAKIFSITTATYVGAPIGIRLDKLERQQMAYVEDADYISRNIFELLADLSITKNEQGIKANSVVKPTLIFASIITWGIVGLVASAEPNDFFKIELSADSPQHFDNLHLIRISNDPLEFAICQAGNS